MLYIGWFILITLLGVRASEARADCILVPGARVEADGQPGPSLKGRLDEALRLYRQGRAGTLVCTGGKGESGPIESEVARDYLIARGVPGDAIVLERMSHTTWENFAFARQEMERKGLHSCLVVTDPFHIQRCLWMASEAGLQGYPAPSFNGPAWRPGGALFYTTREMLAWVKYGAERAGR